MGDLAIKADEQEKCPCGRHFPLIKKIIGRDTDIVHTRSGKALIVHFFTGVFEHFETIQQFRVVQKVKEEIEIEFIPAENFTNEVLDKVQKKMYERAEESFPVRFIQVKYIATTTSGKPQIIQNLIATKLI